MLEKVKLALRLTTEAFDGELTLLIEAAKKDLGIAGVSNVTESDALITRAIITFCKMNFEGPEEYERLKSSYDEQKAQLGTSSDYTIF